MGFLPSLKDLFLITFAGAALLSSHPYLSSLPSYHPYPLILLSLLSSLSSYLLILLSFPLILTSHPYPLIILILPPILSSLPLILTSLPYPLSPILSSLSSHPNSLTPLLALSPPYWFSNTFELLILSSLLSYPLIGSLTPLLVHRMPILHAYFPLSRWPDNLCRRPPAAAVGPLFSYGFPMVFSHLSLSHPLIGTQNAHSDSNPCVLPHLLSLNRIPSEKTCDFERLERSWGSDSWANLENLEKSIPDRRPGTS